MDIVLNWLKELEIIYWLIVLGIMISLTLLFSFVRGFNKSLEHIKRKHYYSSKFINIIDVSIGRFPEWCGFLCKKYIFKHIFSAQLMIHSVKCLNE